MAIIAIVLQGCKVENRDSIAVDAKVDVYEKLDSLSIELMKVTPPTANFVPAVRTGNLVYTSGNIPRKQDGTVITGKLGADVTLAEGQEAARLVAIKLLSVIHSEVGDLNKVKRVVKVLGMVSSDPSFTEQHKVMNGFSDLIVEVLGDKGKHARSAVGMATMPLDACLEIEMIVEVEN